jgi:hypothetical protein
VRAHEVIAVLLVAVPAALLLALSVRDRGGHIERELRSVHRRAIGHLEVGMFRVVGRACRAGGLLAAPISGRPCLAWRLVVEAPRRSGPFWLTVADMRSSAEFWVEDPSGRAAVSPDHHFVLAVDTPEAAVRGEWDRLPDGVADTLVRLHGSPQVRTAIWLPTDGRWLRYTEARLEEDQILCVGGEVHREPHPMGEVSLGRSTPMRWLFRGTQANPLIVMGGPV